MLLFSYHEQKECRGVIDIVVTGSGN